MEWYVAGPGLIALLVILLIIGLPIPFALAAATLPFLWAIQGFGPAAVSAELMIWQAWDNYVLVAIPLFVFLGDLVCHSRIGHDLYQAMHRGFRFRGAAAMGSVGACAGFGAVCGSSLIGALTIGRVALPQMLSLGYGPRLAAGVVAAGGTLSVMIPPSLVLLFYGIVTDESIGRLFVAGVLPGFLLTGLFLAVVAIWARVKASDVPALEDGGEVSSAVLTGVLPIAVVGLVIFGAIYFGIATPTEAAAIAVVIMALFAFTLGRLSLRGAGAALLATIRTMGYIGILLATALLFGFVLNYYRVPQGLASFIAEQKLSPHFVLFFVITFFFLIGMVLEPMSIIFIALPTVYPLVKAAGFDMVWFGIIFTILMEIGVLTPPVGLNLFVLQGLAPADVKISDVFLGCLPFIGAQLLLILCLLAVPELALWLPRQME